MLGMLCRQERGRVQPETVRVAGMRVLCVRVKEGGRGETRRLARGAKLLRRAGVRYMLENAEGQPSLPGLPVVSALPLYRAVADRLVLERLGERGIVPERATVVLRGEYPDSELAAAARALCPRVRQVIVDTERGGDVLQRSLLRQFGVAVMPVQDRRDVVTVRFSGKSCAEELNLCGEVDLAGLSVDAPQVVLPETLVRASTVCALWQAGLLELSQVRVSRAEQENNSLDIRPAW